MRRMYRLWGIGLILVGLATLYAVFGGTSASPASISTEPIVMLPPEPTWVWPGPLLQVREEEAGTWGHENAEDVVLLPPRALASTPLPASQESEGTTTSIASPPRLTVSLWAEPQDEVSPLLGWPVNSSEITQGFGCSPYYTGLPGPYCPAEAPWFHDGLDIGAVSGALVRAAITGTVLFAGPDGSGPECGGYHGYGLAVVVDTGTGWQALYAHLARIQVSVGQTVTPEIVIGQVGTTGCVSGAHLHFGLRYHGELVDPAEWQE